VPCYPSPICYPLIDTLLHSNPGENANPPSPHANLFSRDLHQCRLSSSHLPLFPMPCHLLIELVSPPIVWIAHCQLLTMFLFRKVKRYILSNIVTDMRSYRFISSSTQLVHLHWMATIYSTNTLISIHVRGALFRKERLLGSMEVQLFKNNSNMFVPAFTSPYVIGSGLSHHC